MNLFRACRALVGAGGSIPPASRVRSPSGPSPCKWCGDVHGDGELCKGARVNRRTFLFTASAAAVGALVPSVGPTQTIWQLSRLKSALFLATYDFDTILKEHYVPYIAAQLNAGFAFPFGEDE